MRRDLNVPQSASGAVSAALAAMLAGEQLSMQVTFEYTPVRADGVRGKSRYVTTRSVNQTHCHSPSGPAAECNSVLFSLRC
jgi:hypothetical protein